MKRLIAIALLLALSASAQFNPPVQLLDTGLLGPFTATQIQGMFGTPIVLINAPGAGKTIQWVSAMLNIVYGGTPITAGGNIGLFYTQTSPPTQRAGANLNTTTFTSASSNTLLTFGPGNVVGATSYVNQPLCLSNITQAFAGGTGSTFYVQVKYYIQSGLR